MTSSDASNIKLDMQPQVVEEIELYAMSIAAPDRDVPLMRPRSHPSASAEIHARARKYYETIVFASVLFLVF